MNTDILVRIILSAIIALLVAVVHYFLKAKRTDKKTVLFAFFRFLGVFLLLLLLVNPQITVTKTTIQKPDLVVLVDQSKSISYLNRAEKVKNTVAAIKQNKKINERFELSILGFGNELTDSIVNQFSDQQTKINSALSEAQKIYRNSNTPVLLISDGNQTYGSNYEYYQSKNNQSIYAVAIGDTTQVSDLEIKTVNVNKYAYLNNNFPVEILVNYKGNQDLKSTLKITQGTRVIHREVLNFTTEKKAHLISKNIKATKPGVQNYTINIVPFKGEKNTYNNSKNSVVEVIDQKAKILLVSELTHPDIGALKQSVESNKRSTLIIKKPNQITELDNYRLVIIYQPKASFKKVYELVNAKKIPLFTITGMHTDWNFLNNLQRNYTKKTNKQLEEVIPQFSNSFELFNTDTFNLENYPPLESTFGNVTLSPPFETLLTKEIAGVTTNYPLLAFWSENSINEVVLFGEGIWKWRLANYKRDENFKQFDDLFGSVIQFLINKKSRKRLILNNKSIYYLNNSIKIRASFFNKNYEINTKGQLLITVTNTKTKEVKKVPMVLKNNSFEADLSYLELGDYRFSVTEKRSNITSYGSFSVLDFDFEKQFRCNKEGLLALASKNNGEVFYKDQMDKLINTLLQEPKFTPIQKVKKEKIALINWKLILPIILLLFGIEWFLRKYNGLN